MQLRRHIHTTSSIKQNWKKRRFVIFIFTYHGGLICTPSQIKLQQEIEALKQKNLERRTARSETYMEHHADTSMDTLGDGIAV